MKFLINLLKMAYFTSVMAAIILFGGIFLLVSLFIMFMLLLYLTGSFFTAVPILLVGTYVCYLLYVAISQRRKRKRKPKAKSTYLEKIVKCLTLVVKVIYSAIMVALGALGGLIVFTSIVFIPYGGPLVLLYFWVPLVFYFVPFAMLIGVASEVSRLLSGNNFE